MIPGRRAGAPPGVGRSGARAQLLAEERQRAVPGTLGGVGVVDPRAVVVEERVGGPRVLVERRRDRAAVALDLDHRTGHRSTSRGRRGFAADPATGGTG